MPPVPQEPHLNRCGDIGIYTEWHFCISKDNQFSLVNMDMRGIYGAASVLRATALVLLILSSRLTLTVHDENRLYIWNGM